MHWILPERALPRGLGELALVDADDAELGPLLVEVLPARKSDGTVDPATRVVSASARVPVTARELGEEHLAGWAERLEAALARLMPFSRDHLLHRSVPVLDAPAVRAGRLPAPAFRLRGAARRWAWPGFASAPA